MSSKNQVQAQLDNMLHFFTKQGFTYPSIRYELNNIKIQSEDEAKVIRSKMKDIYTTAPALAPNKQLVGSIFPLTVFT